MSLLNYIARAGHELAKRTSVIIIQNSKASGISQFKRTAATNRSTFKSNRWSVLRNNEATAMFKIQAKSQRQTSAKAFKQRCHILNTTPYVNQIGNVRIK
jgi:aspartyl/asparaginyl-tRNA synthetase